MLEHIKAVIFDLDGTLVDSMWMWKAIDIEFLKEYGRSCPDNLQKKIEGMSFSETAVYFKERFDLPVSVEEIKQRWVEMSLYKYKHRVPLKSGAKEFLGHLRRRGILVGIATSNGREMVDAVLRALEVDSYFQQVITACEVAAGKPAPDIYLRVASELGVNPKECLVFEDIPAGILSAKRAGMRVCAVEDEYSASVQSEKKRLADYYIKNYTKLLAAEQIRSGIQ